VVNAGRGLSAGARPIPPPARPSAAGHARLRRSGPAPGASYNQRSCPAPSSGPTPRSLLLRRPAAGRRSSWRARRSPR